MVCAGNVHASENETIGAICQVPYFFFTPSLLKVIQSFGNF